AGLASRRPRASRSTWSTPSPTSRGGCSSCWRTASVPADERARRRLLRVLRDRVRVPRRARRRAPDVRRLPLAGHGAAADARRTVGAEPLAPRGYAQYAGVALVDETVMSSTWPGAEQWRREPLQVHYYDNLLAGEQFFVRLDELRSGADDDLLEVYFLCLCAGFQGRFRDDPAGVTAHRREAHPRPPPL